MSERKVLNKYYPPDFDPSKIPRSKEPRNKTFTIRLMAPCNMRCTTCGEYIYKGRKFNARKEDVDDMNHLGLRIYRFYIKCTACLSEISFRTDPANTDYILEAGATRNFEALAKAEKQAEEEQRAYDEELKTNPMKLLEERTEASKFEMDRMEALEELQELNKRELKVNYEDLLGRYDRLRKSEDQVQQQEQLEDEEFVKSIFGKDGNNSIIKRIVDDDSDEEDGGGEAKPALKKIKVESATDLLTDKPSKSDTKQPWEKSIGSLGAKKGLGVLVKKKDSASASTKTNVSAGTGTNDGKQEVKAPSSAPTASSSAGASLLSLVGDYSDSD